MNRWTVILWSGALVGTLDITSALVNYFIKTHNNPMRVFPYIASGIFGKDAFSGSVAMNIAGLLFHYIIAYCFTIAFFLIYPRIKFLSYNWILSGILYGMIIWSLMNLVVVPLSYTHAATITFNSFITNLVILIVAIGLPLSYIAQRYYSPEHHNQSSSSI